MSVIEDIWNELSTFEWRLSFMLTRLLLLLNHGLVKQVHKFHGVCLNMENDLFDTCYKIILTKISHNPDHKPSKGGHHGRIDTSGKKPDVNVITRH